MLLRKHAEFFNFVVSEWTNEVEAEVGVGYEFLDKTSIIRSDLTRS